MERLALLLVLLATCAAPHPVAPPPAPVAPAEPPPAPPPKCEALSEHCASKRGTRATIGAVSWTIELPEGWTYAHGVDVVAVSDSAALTVTSYDLPARAKGKQRATAREAAIAIASGRIEIQPPKKLVWPKSPHRTSKVAGLEVSLFQFAGAKRANAPGPLLVFTAPLSAERVLLGLAFVAEKDTSNADAAILQAIASLAPDPAPETRDAGAP